MFLISCIEKIEMCPSYPTELALLGAVEARPAEKQGVLGSGPAVEFLWNFIWDLQLAISWPAGGILLRL